MYTRTYACTRRYFNAYRYGRLLVHARTYIFIFSYISYMRMDRKLLFLGFRVVGLLGATVEATEHSWIPGI